MTHSPAVAVIGAGLAGSEAAWQLARLGIRVELCEMRPCVMTPAHTTGGFAELVCSNSLGTESPSAAPGLLKDEMRQCGSLIMAAAEASRVPAGRALAVDRHAFSAAVEARLAALPEVTVIRQESATLPEGRTAVIATGPLTSPQLSAAIAQFVGCDNLYFYDALAPIVTAESVDPELSYWGSRYGVDQKGVAAAGGGSGDYLNCPLDRLQYLALRSALVAAPRHLPHPFERGRLFEGCLPVEVLAERGEDTMRFGPLKPVGLDDPRSGLRPYAVLQLRREDSSGHLLNLVGCQTNLTQAAQREVFRLVPALRAAEFARYGAMHRNTYLHGPRLLRPTLETRSRQGLFFAGQLTGVEGYTESAASGLAAGLAAAARAMGREPRPFPDVTMIGALCRFVSSAATEDFQPMNANFGLLPPLERRCPRRERPLLYRRRSLDAVADFLAAGA
ncbi:MAG: methylenetetrahydrofolate--tRNA-(uracil(54)-C(5))-methyltransferase (FADH(2)-oxidizing) TrmFO [Bacillota bacterium]|nr:methylenetetrahydrofolate--tRNA-(uracil(54)-C(5))-methyltransferase (FADH(2)-oxidizing) TrmFO [Bacillota bacterium]